MLSLWKTFAHSTLIQKICLCLKPKFCRTILENEYLSPEVKYIVIIGAGFVGSHLVDRLMIMGHEVICVDNLFTGSKRNIKHWFGHENFEFIRHDVIGKVMNLSKIL